jgi:hypothetical protein
MAREPENDLEEAEAGVSFLREVLGDSTPDVVRFHTDQAAYDIPKPGMVLPSRGSVPNMDIQSGQSTTEMESDLNDGPDF